MSGASQCSVYTPSKLAEECTFILLNKKVTLSGEAVYDHGFAHFIFTAAVKAKKTASRAFNYAELMNIADYIQKSDETLVDPELDAKRKEAIAFGLQLLEEQGYSVDYQGICDFN